ncbi:penicillin amidase [Mucilaginibacter gracilis]|uniref:Penicillin amidase n=1 Tax=Mucilaginibacter gracilis TaxID=423350 RepID=A0A495JA00_9SPHI|nr:penicillin acylase family protein [Mucilaginibacter gracilis]RKR85192.1 penicillin amidase [Mucilaginibacter gracilis]
MKFFIACLVSFCTLLLIWALQTKFGDIPPIGKFLNPVSGFWQNAESKNIDTKRNIKLDGLSGNITIKYDEYMIPHIFADNDHDLYFAQGYVTAQDRLWQMDIQTRSASGRLSEVVGPKALDLDRYHRRMGMVFGAENTLKECMKDPQVKAMLMAYCDGVNAYIHNLPSKYYPIEFKLLDYAPEDYTPLDCTLVLKLMSETLAGGSDDFQLTNTLKYFGAKVTNDLFPDHYFKDDPIIPTGTKWDFKPLPIPKPSKGFIGEMTDTIKTKQKVDGIGSNNWVVAGSRSANGYPILANDPHLNLTFPSIWYQVQLAAPGVNVNGVSLPGTPAVIIGFNQHIGWGVTNVDADVLDWYQIRFKDLSKKEYWYNGKWIPDTRRVEEIKIRGQKTMFDTVIYTHIGPVVYASGNSKPKMGRAANVPVGHALRWIAHDPSLEFKTFYLLNRGKNYTDYREALKYFSAPAQNFIFASNDKDIAITPNGKFPLKYKDQGKYILDGGDTADAWHVFIPMEQNPTVKNPEQGFLSSANQESTDSTYPYYINWHFSSYTRGKRINDKLRAMHHATVDSLRLLQTDNYSIFAEDVLGTMLADLDQSKMSGEQKQAYKVIATWDKQYSAGSIAASIFDLWWTKLYLAIWSDDFTVKKDINIQLKWPSNYRTIELLTTQKTSKWYDDSRTQEVETRAALINKSFDGTIDSLTRKYGKLGATWQWGTVKGSDIAHLGNVPGFGTGPFSAGGAAGVINALSDTHGPSWRMVLQFGPKVQGYGVFPGGESGNPGSYYYDNMFTTWKNGQLNPLLFLQTPTDAAAHIKTTLTLSNK